MWEPLKRLLGRSKGIGALLGDVVYITPGVKGQYSHSTFQWRVKRGLNEKSVYVSLAMKPDGYIGAEGSPTNYINFDIATAEQLRADLDDCIAEAKRLAAGGNPSS